MINGKKIMLLLGVLLLWGASSYADEVNLLPNGSFEAYSCNLMGCQFNDWNMALGSGSASTDRIDGEVALMVNPTSVATVLDQGVALTDANYAVGAKFAITINYKVKSMPEGSNLALDCYWEAAAGGSSESIEAHESDILRVPLNNESDWMPLTVFTTKPAKSAYLRVRVKVPKNAKVLFDNFKVVKQESTDPFIEVTPSKLNSVSVNLGQTVDFQTVHIKQGNLTGPTTFRIGGEQAGQFSLSATELPADQTDLDLIITYAPTSAGTHTANLIFDNAQHTTILPDMIPLSGTCSDPSAKPEITVTPTSLPEFSVVVGQSQTQTLSVSSVNCTDYVYMRVDHISPEEHGAFTIDGSMMGKNTTGTVTVRFAPLSAGTYQSTLTVYSENADPVVVTLNGKAEAKSEDNIDWQTNFNWDQTTPLTYMYEKFDQVDHNQTIVLNGWQNVANVDQRPWWGFDESKTSPARGTETYAKATAYQYAKPTTGTWETWLVTPALDYKNAASKTFAFSVMGEYLPDEESATLFEIYYVDPSQPEELRFQNLTESFTIPKTADENLHWNTFFLDLAPYAETMADVFHMAFRYTGPNGNEGVVTYYIDDVSWGRTDLPEIIVSPASIIDDAAVLNTKKTIGTISVSSRNLTNPITLSLAGANYNRFELSATSLPIEGGEVAVSFEGQEEGVHEAYVCISSKGAPDKYVPMAVLCKAAQGIGEVTGNGLQVTGQKILRDGQLFILRGEKTYNAQGQIVR